jgi:type I restriction enzyme S subunit
MKHWMLGLSSGGTRKAITKGHIESFVVPVPPAAEQRAIAGVLGALDDKIESNRRRAETAESLLDVLASSVEGLPATPLGDVVVVHRDSCTPATLGETLVDHFSMPAFDAERLPDRTPGASIKSNKLVVAQETVLVSRLNPSTNRTWFAVPEPGTLAAASTEFMVLRPGVATGLGAVWLAVRSESFRAVLARRATGTSGSHQRVKPNDVLAIDVPDVRHLGGAAVAEAEGLLRLAHQARMESRTLAELRDALLPELLSGRLRVPVAEELVDAAT